eukprot:CAMPEP_0178373968 /NCGR_PEP_ID=MMETSP0689_2-20121128/2136_1 /TAXON_ID=160604 /ORGANISM="Amphidinium massartii, Strain CS-259" /LENGTH=582 /DNA_ID=CAMNT_0019993927 /DNA_START=49 /DNA_END=1794 /DNA_ORIENTATION=+
MSGMMSAAILLWLACVSLAASGSSESCHAVEVASQCLPGTGCVSSSLLQTLQTAATSDFPSERPPPSEIQHEEVEAVSSPGTVSDEKSLSSGTGEGRKLVAPEGVESQSATGSSSSVKRLALSAHGASPWSVTVSQPMVIPGSWIPGSSFGSAFGSSLDGRNGSRSTSGEGGFYISRDDYSALRSHDDRLRIALAATVVGMVVVIIVFFYLAHFPQKDIRRAMWSVVGSTLTCFCAMLLFNALKESTMGLLSEPEDFHGNDEDYERPTFLVLRHHLIRASVLLALLYTCLSFLAHLPRTKEVFAGIGAHIVGFSLTEAFGGLQLEEPFNESPLMSFLVVLIAGSVIISIVATGTTLRSCWFKEYDEEMEAAFEEAENHYTGLTIGLLFCQTIKFMIVGHLAPVHGAPKGKTPFQVAVLLGAALFMALMVTTVSYVNDYVENATTLPLRRVTNIAERVASMTLGWNLLFAGEWAFWSMTGGRGVADDDDMIAGILLLAAFGTFGFLMIFLVDFLAHTRMIEKHAMQALIDGVALAIGLTWEVSIDTSILCLHAVIADQGIRFVDAATDALLFGLILPAHVLYI